MIIKILDPSKNATYLWLPVYFYDEPFQMQILSSIIELVFYISCFHLMTISLYVMLKVQIFHRNLYILAGPMLCVWYGLIVGKLITIAYRLKFVNLDYELGEHIAIWTDDQAKMLNVSSLRGLELLIFGGYVQWHYMYTVVYGILGVAAERAIASVLIENYETNTQLYIPIALTIITQFLAISTSLSVLFYKASVFLSHLPWIISCSLGALAYLFIKIVNENFQKQITNPRRKRLFTISQQFQVKENLRALRLGTRLVFVVFFYVAFVSFGMFALAFDLVSSAYCHFVENFLFLNPYPICFTAMLTIPQWRKHFQNACFTWRLVKSTWTKPQTSTISVELCTTKKLEAETDLYFRQLNESWI